jgi:hypothetical protein
LRWLWSGRLHGGREGSMRTPFTGQACGCKRGVQRDNCPNCEGTGRVIDFAVIRMMSGRKQDTCGCPPRLHCGDQTRRHPACQTCGYCLSSIPATCVSAPPESRGAEFECWTCGTYDSDRPGARRSVPTPLGQDIYNTAATHMAAGHDVRPVKVRP